MLNNSGEADMRINQEHKKFQSKIKDVFSTKGDPSMQKRSQQFTL